eukprot:3035387-Rhodomonas_salina.1
MPATHADQQHGRQAGVSFVWGCVWRRIWAKEHVLECIACAAMTQMKSAQQLKLTQMEAKIQDETDARGAVNLVSS